MNFSSSDFTETASDKGDAVIVECNGLSYELAVGGEEWQKIADFWIVFPNRQRLNIELIKA